MIGACQQVSDKNNIKSTEPNKHQMEQPEESEKQYIKMKLARCILPLLPILLGIGGNS
jgi:hypothetical protein